MTKIAIVPNAAGTGTFTIEAPNSNSNRTLVLPDAAGTVMTDATTLLTSQLPAQLSVSSSAGAGALTVDASGRVTTPSQPAFNASVSTAGTLVAPTLPLIIPYSNILLNVGSHYNSSNYRFTAPVAGNYMFYGGFAVWLNSDVRGLEFELRKNGSAYARGEQFIAVAQGGNTHVTCQVSAVIPLAVNDYVEVVWVSATAAVNLYRQSRGNFSGYLIG
jgi:hypothetical protein